MEAVTQISISMPNVPSSLAKVGDKLRAANVNILAITCNEGNPNSLINIVVDDPEWESHETHHLSVSGDGPFRVTPGAPFITYGPYPW